MNGSHTIQIKQHKKWVIFAAFNTNAPGRRRYKKSTTTESQNLDETIPNNDISSPQAQAVMGMQLMAMREPRDKSGLSVRHWRGRN
jgi:hypothetical protein